MGWNLHKRNRLVLSPLQRFHSAPGTAALNAQLATINEWWHLSGPDVSEGNVSTSAAP